MSCEDCAKFKSPNRGKQLPLQDNRQPSRPGELVSMDIVGPIRESGQLKYILVVMDVYSRFVQLYALKTQKASEIAQQLMKYISVFGVFDTLLTDNGTNFQSEILKRLAEQLGVKQLKTSPYHPQTNGANERSHCQLRKSLAIFADQTGDWPSHIDYFQLLINAQINSTTNFSPYFIMFGQEPNLPHTVKLQEENKNANLPIFVESKLKKMAEIQKLVTANCKEAKGKQQEYRLHKKAELRDFQREEKVWVYFPNLDQKVYSTKQPLFRGPFIIQERLGAVNYRVIEAHKPNARPQIVHAQRIIKFTERLPHLRLDPDESQTIPKSLDLEIARECPVLNEELDEFEEQLPLQLLL
ncbi:hypothetical protein JTE90_022797, partial [Oedothorax gibbosus]